MIMRGLGLVAVTARIGQLCDVYGVCEVEETGKEWIEWY